MPRWYQSTWHASTDSLCRGFRPQLRRMPSAYPVVATQCTSASTRRWAHSCRLFREQRLVNLVGIIERRTVDVEVFARPRITACRRRLAVGITPIAFAPITRMVRYAGMRYAASKRIRFGQHILRHKTAIRCRHTANSRRIDLWYVGCKALGGFDYVLCRTFAHRVDMARRPFLPETCRARRIDDKHDVAQSIPIMCRIVRPATEAARR